MLRCDSRGPSRNRRADRGLKPVLSLTREHRGAHLPAGVAIDRAPIEHRKARGDVKTADGDRPERRAMSRARGYWFV